MDPFDERGLVGKSTVVLLILVVVLGVAAVDAGSILFAKLQVSDLTQQAAFDGAVAYRNTKDADAALERAVETVTQRDDTVRVRDFSVDAGTGDVTLTVTKIAPTLVVEHVGALRRYRVVRASATAAPPS